MVKEAVNTQTGESAFSRILPWMFPVAYLLHIAEEYFADFPSHLFITQGITLTYQRFILLQSIGLILMVAGIAISRKLHFPNQMLAVLAALVTANSLVHLVRSVLFGGYEPGLFTALLLWLPLGAVTMLHLRTRMPSLRFVVSVATGVAISAAVELITLSEI